MPIEVLCVYCVHLSFKALLVHRSGFEVFSRRLDLSLQLMCNLIQSGYEIMMQKVTGANNESRGWRD